MERKYYVVGGKDPSGPWYRVSVGLDEYPDMKTDDWLPEGVGFEYQYYKVVEVWEFPF